MIFPMPFSAPGTAAEFDDLIAQAGGGVCCPLKFPVVFWKKVDMEAVFKNMSADRSSDFALTEGFLIEIVIIFILIGRP